MKKQRKMGGSKRRLGTLGKVFFMFRLSIFITNHFFFTSLGLTYEETGGDNEIGP
jgi:hypothetical protein